MFIFKFFKDSVNLKTILTKTDKNIFKILIYFILLIIIANFPMSYETVKERGSRLDFIIEDFIDKEPVEWDLPSDIQVIGGKLITNNNDKVYINNHKEITYVINNKEKIDAKNNLNHIFLNEESIVYIDSKGNFLEAFGYKGFSTDIYNFVELKNASPEMRKELFIEFVTYIEKSFSTEIVFFTILRNNAVQIVINILYALLLSGLVMLFKFGYQKFLSFKQVFVFVILSMGIPAILSFIIGIFSAAFAPVIYQLTSGMIVMGVMLFFGKKTIV